jgi:DNA mismatch endonuclease (patch repair protein)
MPAYGTPSAETSARMSNIRSKDTKPELLVRRYLHAQGFRFRIHANQLPGKPDIILPKYKTAVLIQGCFWHSHGPGCGIKARPPRTNQSFWLPKLARIVQRDSLVKAQLQAAGWQVLLIWECELEKPIRGATLSRLNLELLSNGKELEAYMVDQG